MVRAFMIALASVLLVTATAVGAEPKKVSLEGWPEVAKKAYQEMEAKYGAPDGVAPSRMVWTNKGPFKAIILTKEVHQHDFPKPHGDCLEHVVEYKVPADKASDLIKSDGSLSFNRTAGTLSARCDSEAHNIGSLNLAVEIITGKKNVEQARQAHAEAVKQEIAGQMPQSMKQLAFQPQPKAGDSDVAVVGAQAGQSQSTAARPQTRQE